MITRVDWISFSILVAPQPNGTQWDMAQQCYDSLEALNTDIPEILQIDNSWTFQKGRAPYEFCYRRPDNAISIYAHRNLSHALVEIAGRGCEELHANSKLHDILRAAQKRLTRLDLACDMHTDTNPLEFAVLRDTGRFRSHSEVVSESGTTCYIGSKTSDRYSRVYRYNPPHERAHLLRCEYVVKAENAKLLAQSILSDGELACAATLGNTFGWQHKDWNVDSENAAEIEVWRPERREGKTLFWLADTIAPLLIRLHREGIIDVTKWFNDNVVDKYNDDSV